jgi:NAD(P)-dependent dehydrogenase (short-subunit alcohol dehydrogenase family)
MHGRTVIVTGANAGVGRATALGLARLGATVVMLCRSRERGEEARDAVRRESRNDAVELAVADLASQASIRAFAEEFLSRHESLHVLVNNAAVIAPARTLTVDGIETQFAVNHLAPFLLTHLLFARLRQSAPARVVNVSSGMHRRTGIDFNNLQGERHYHPRRIYAQTKLCNVLFTVDLAGRTRSSGVTANALHPGTISTGLYGRFLGLPSWLGFVSQWYGSSPERGAATPIYLAASPEVAGVTGQYFKNRRPAPMNPLAHDAAVRRRLWELSEKLTGIGETAPPLC